MAFTDQYALGHDATFIGRVAVAMCKAAAAVQAEDPATAVGPPAFTGAPAALHAQRSKLAQQALTDQDTWAGRFAMAVAADPGTAGITAASADDDILFTVNSLWNTFAIGG